MQTLARSGSVLLLGLACIGTIAFLVARARVEGEREPLLADAPAGDQGVTLLDERPLERAARREPLAGESTPTSSTAERDLGGALPSFTVIVVDPGRTPLAGALVRGSAENGWAAERETDESGRAELGVPAAIDEVVLLVELDGFAHQRVKQQVREEIELVLFPATTIEGRVLERGTGRAISGAVVERKHVTCTACPLDRALTDDTGRFDLSGVPSGSADQLLRVLVRASGYVGEKHEFVAREPGVVITCDYELQPRKELHGQVVDLSTGEPIAGARLGTGIDAFITDASGRFSTAGATSREPPFNDRSSDGLVVRASGYCPMTLPLAGLETPLLIRLPRGAILIGSVLDPEGRPPPGASLHLSNQWIFDGRQGAGTPLALLPDSWRIDDGQFQSSTGVDGRYRFDEVLPWCEAHRLWVMVEGYPPIDLVVPVGLPGKELELDVTLQRADTGTIQGHLTLNGWPVSGTVAWQNDVHSGETKAEGGRYRLEHLPVGAIELKAMPIGKAIDQFVPAARATLLLAPDQELLHDFHLELPLGAIAGRVTREDGSPVADLDVRVRTEQLARSQGIEQSIWSDAVRTDAQGVYGVTVPERGFSFTISVSDGGVKRAQTGVLAGNERVDFVLPQMGQLLFRVIRRGTGDAVDRCGLSWRPAGRGEYERLDPETWGGRRPFTTKPIEDAHGFRRVRLPVGYVDLHLYAGSAGFQPALRDNVLVRGEGEPERVTFELERGIEVHLQLDPPGRLPSSAFVALPPAELWNELSCTRNERGNNRLSFGGRYPATGLGGVFFDNTGRSRVAGLAPGKYRFKVFHEQIQLEPEEIDVGASGPGSKNEPILVRWSWRTE